MTRRWSAAGATGSPRRTGSSVWDRAARGAIDQDGLSRAYDRLVALAAELPHATVIHASTVEQTYQALLTTVRAAGS
ncbi:hypothetical protein [Actinocrispum sp. NPDC049592]|uniref:hypothetical protein n=1 Tax=Actinocrispum sp. NPDC049592 TaxID=3154835 RepID=UPI00342EC429